ncbi:MAG: MBL fold metallo-hydrolase [Aeropyrum sp.]|nr:MBL fold metallo-hydrolase [Aeropyrum sp.]MCE4615884.1 MBL fold metallo-hydrolase [Aeropyrum sp.]
MELKRVVGSTYYVRGSPSTLIHIQSGIAYVIDPGHSSKRARRIGKELRSAGVREILVLITHYHSDHYSSRSIGELGPARVLAPAREYSLIASGKARTLLTYGYPTSKPEHFILHPVEEVQGLEVLDVNMLREVQTIQLPGHTEGHTGFSTEDGVLYVGDAVFGDRVLSAYPIPFHTRPCDALQSLKILERLAGRHDYFLMGHGGLVRRADVIEVLDSNAKAIERGFVEVERALSRGLGTPGEIAYHIISTSRESQEKDKALVGLTEIIVRGYLACMYDDGLVEPFVSHGGLAWRLARG